MSNRLAQLLLLLVTWGKAKTINSMGVWLMAKICTAISTTVLFIIYCSQASVVGRLNKTLRDIIGLNQLEKLEVTP